MLRIYYLVAILFITGTLPAQEYQEISTGAGYSKHSFVNLSTGEQTQINHTDWDICFTIQGLTSAGIFINEGAAINPPNVALELYGINSIDFNTVIDPSILTNDIRLYNDEQSWHLGAFNAGANIQAFNYGWGAYNPQTHIVEGNKVFVIKKRDGNYIKFFIKDFSGGAYNITYANLDGTDLRTASIAKADFDNNDMAYFSFQSGSAVALEPVGGYDMIYTRYFYPVTDTLTGVDVQYAVVGVLAGPGTEVVKVDGKNPATVNFEDYRSGLVQRPDAIGYDWKIFDGQAWHIDADLTYFIVTRNKSVYKINFIDFEGTSTGTAVFEKRHLGTLSTVPRPKFVSTFNIFPSLATDEINIMYTALHHIDGESLVTLTSLNGNRVYSIKTPNVEGLNTVRLETSHLPAGTYIVSLQHGVHIISEKVVIVK